MPPILPTPPDQRANSFNHTPFHSCNEKLRDGKISPPNAIARRSLNVILSTEGDRKSKVLLKGDVVVEQRDGATSNGSYSDALTADMLKETADREAGRQAVREIVERHLEVILKAREDYRLDDTDLLSSNVQSIRTLPAEVQRQIAALHSKVRTIIEKVANNIEERKYARVDQAINDAPLSLSERDKARALTGAEKTMHKSFQSLKISIDFFRDLNEMILERIEESESAGGNASLSVGLILANAVLVYEITDFMIGYVKNFAFAGRPEMTKLYEEMKKEHAEARLELRSLRERAKAIGDRAAASGVLAEVEDTERAYSDVEKEWESYIANIGGLQTEVDKVGGMLPSLDLIRDSAKARIRAIKAIQVVRIAKSNLTTIQASVETLKDLRLVSLPPERIGRLLRIEAVKV